MTVKRYAAGSLYEQPRPGGFPVVMASDYDALAARLDQAERLLRRVLACFVPGSSFAQLKRDIDSALRAPDAHRATDSAPAVPEARKGKSFDAFRAECQEYAAASADDPSCPNCDGEGHE